MTSSYLGNPSVVKTSKNPSSAFSGDGIQRVPLSNPFRLPHIVVVVDVVLVVKTQGKPQEPHKSTTTDRIAVAGVATDCDPGMRLTQHATRTCTTCPGPCPSLAGRLPFSLFFIPALSYRLVTSDVCDFYRCQCTNEIERVRNWLGKSTSLDTPGRHFLIIRLDFSFLFFFFFLSFFFKGNGQHEVGSK